MEPPPEFLSLTFLHSFLLVQKCNFSLILSRRGQRIDGRDEIATLGDQAVQRARQPLGEKVTFLAKTAVRRKTRMTTIQRPD